MNTPRPPNPYDGTAHGPLTDDWLGTRLPVWNLSPGPRPPRQVRPPPNQPRPLRALAVKFTQQTLAVTADPVAILPERESRSYLLIQNATGGGVVYVGFGEVPNLSTGIEIIAGGSIELRDPAPANQVYVVCPGGTATVRILEG